MCSQNAKEGGKGNFNWDQGSMLFKVLKRFSLGKNHLLYLFKKSPCVIPPPPLPTGSQHLTCFYSLKKEYVRRNISDGPSFSGAARGDHGICPHFYTVPCPSRQTVCSISCGVLSSHPPLHMYLSVICITIYVKG